MTIKEEAKELVTNCNQFEIKTEKNMNISKTIKQEREARGLTQKELAEAIGVKATQVSRIELNSDSVTMKTLTKYLRFFGWELVVVS